MRRSFYAKLACIGIAKNKKMYIPYLLACIGITTVYYIVSFLEKSEELYRMPGGRSLQSFLGFGIYILGMFAAVFLFYTNSFLTRQRKKEFGLYNILGMGKRNIARMLVWETLILYAAAMAGGLFLGILFSKLAELCAVNLLQGAVSYEFHVDLAAAGGTAALFAVVFALILLHTLRQIRFSKPVELLRSASVGEKPPRANWFLAALGLVILAAAYVFAVTMERPLQALKWFFAAVLMVIVATYLLFISGSVALCRFLQKRKRFYYRKNHFTAVSSMRYRMKRNGAGLASICVLSTMVLVMISVTSCLYIGLEDSLRTMFPQDMMIRCSTLEKECCEKVREVTGGILAEFSEKAYHENAYREIETEMYREGDSFYAAMGLISDFDTRKYNVMFVSLEDYNAVMGKHETLEPDEVLLYMNKASWRGDMIQIQGIGTVRVKKQLSETVPVYDNRIIPLMCLIVPDMAQVEKAYARELADAAYVPGFADPAGAHDLAGASDETRMYSYLYYGFDLKCDDDTQIRIRERVMEELLALRDPDIACRVPFDCESIANNRADFYELFGSLFFLGIVLSIVFLLATVLIIYYKQIAEGYEDRAGFEIMQKVGMAEREIRRSVNSQVRIIFFAPLLASGLHTAFAFPLLRRLLVLFGYTNTPLLLGTVGACFVLFGFFYIIVYRLTSRAYYRLVSG